MAFDKSPQGLQFCPTEKFKCVSFLPIISDILQLPIKPERDS